MGRYILVRILKSLLSIAIVVSVVVVMVYKLVPTSKVFENDEGYRKLKANQKYVYSLSKLEHLGYLDYLTIGEMFANESESSVLDHKPGDEEYERVLQVYRDKGYEVEELTMNDDLRGSWVAYRHYNVFELIGGFFSRLFVIDNPNAIQDPNNPDMDRGYSWEKDHNGNYALTCEGCTNLYQIYFNNKFPFIHQNIFKLYFGESYPTHSGVHTLDVIGRGQGRTVRVEQTFPTGEVLEIPIDQHTRQYKYMPDRLDVNKYGDSHYATTGSFYESPSMIGTSYIFGLLSLIFGYAIALPAGLAMARKKGMWVDKIGIAYINLILALPSLALIFFIKYAGFGFGLPDKFPELGFGNIKSYIMPLLALTIMNTPGIMMWIRRYMVDQETADYVKFAKSKGLTDKEISKRHILKNAIIPIINGLPSSVILAIGGAIVTESMFAVPGMGKMLPDAINGANNNMVITLTFIFTSLAVFSVFLGDLLMTVVDPRISLDIKEGVR